MQKNHHILICPWCGKVEQDRELSIINYSKIFCDDCGNAANMKLHRIKKNSSPVIKNFHNIIVRKALKEEVQALLNFYMKHAEIQVNNLEKVEIMRYGTEKQLAELFVAEIEGEIIGLSIKEPDELEQFEGCLLNLYLFSLILDKLFLHTNAFDIVINEVLKLNQKTVQAQFVSIIRNVCSVVEVLAILPDMPLMMGD